MPLSFRRALKIILDHARPFAEMIEVDQIGVCRKARIECGILQMFVHAGVGQNGAFAGGEKQHQREAACFMSGQ